MPDDEPWAMDELQREFERIVRQTQEAGDGLTTKQVVRVAAKTTNNAGRAFYRTLIEIAPDMLADRRKERAGFERRNFQRWRKAFDLIETIWVSCEELGRAFNQHHRPIAVSEQDYEFEAMTHLHAKALLVTSEMICLLKGGFADGALTRWRTLYEVNVIAALIRQEGQELALRYLAHSRVQAWNEAQDDPIETDEAAEDQQRLKADADHAIQMFGLDLNRRNGWACALTGQKNPTFERMAQLAGKTDEKSFYQHASLHVHGNHRGYDELLGMCEAHENLLLVGPSNSGLVGPLTLAAFSMVEINVDVAPDQAELRSHRVRQYALAHGEADEQARERDRASNLRSCPEAPEVEQLVMRLPRADAPNFRKETFLADGEVSTLGRHDGALRIEASRTGGATRPSRHNGLTPRAA